MRIIRHADCRPMPWKNGGGVTTEIMAWPPAAGLDAFDWRISMAQVASGGPFSAFPGIDRTLTVLDGAMRLDAGEAPPVELSARSAPYAFPGDVNTMATLIEGPVLDFNVMTRREIFRHRVERLELSNPSKIALDQGTMLAFVTSGEASLRHQGEVVRLSELDTVLLEAREGVLEIAPLVPATLLLVTIQPR